MNSKLQLDGLDCDPVTALTLVSRAFLAFEPLFDAQRPPRTSLYHEERVDLHVS